MVNADQYFELAENFRMQGNIPLAVQMYNEVLRLKPDFGLVYANMAKIMNAQGNHQGEYDALKHFANCPLTMLTVDMVPGIKQRLVELDKQFGASIPIK